MKRTFIIIFALILVFAVIPPLVITNCIPTPDKGKIAETVPTEGTTAVISSDDEIEYAVSDSMQYIDSDTPAEVRCAVLEICRNNLKYHLINNLELPQVSITKYNDNLYQNLVKEYQTEKLIFSFDDKTVYIPLSETGHLATATSDEFPYLESVATPFEAYREDFRKTDTPPSGVSVYGLTILSEQMEIIDALSYYLPLLEINKK